MTRHEGASTTVRERRGAMGGGAIAVAATITAYANDGAGAALLTAVVSLAAVAFVLALWRVASR